MQSITDGTLGWSPLRRSFWRAAWHPLAVIGGIWLLGFAIGNGLMIPGSFVLGRDGLGTQVLLSIVGAACGISVWAGSIWYVNRQTVDLESELHRLGRGRFETDSGLSVTVTTVGTQFGLNPASSYRLTVTHVDDETVAIERAEFDTERWSLTEYPQVTMPRDRLEDIGTERDELSVRIDDSVWNIGYRKQDTRRFESRTTSRYPEGN